MSIVPEPSPSRNHLDFALGYVAAGMAVVPIWWVDADGKCGCGDAHDGSGDLSPNSRGKHPHGLFARHGSLSASRDETEIRRWWDAEPRLSIGIATGEASGIVAIDIDPRDGGDQTWDHFVERNGGHVPDTIVANTGGGGQHILFRYEPDQVIRSPGKGVQVKGNGGYIVVEPSMHHSGRAYCWQAECDPLEGAVAAPAPDWLVMPKTADLLRPVKGGQKLTGFLHPQRIADLRAAMRYLDPDPYETWIHVGMALHSTDALEAFEIWDTWSQQSAKYAPAAQTAKWASFTSGNGLHIESVFAWAMAAGWTGESDPVPVPVAAMHLAVPAPVLSAAACGLLALPGPLGEFVQWINRTAPKTQPAFAVSAALALGSVACGRRYRGMPRKNWTSLYFLNVGKSGCGKEYARTAINRALTEAQWPELIGMGGYASDAAVMSLLEHQPIHISIIDEFGALLGNAQSEGAMHQRAAITTLIEAWGNLHGTMRPKAYSLSSLPREQAEAMLKRTIHNPAITLLGMTTPGTFYGALSAGSVEGGFLGRLLITETHIGRQPAGEPSDDPIPPCVIEWLQAVKTVRQRRSTGNLAGIEPTARDSVTPIDVPCDARAKAAFDAFDRESMASQDAMEAEGLEELDARRFEQALRVAVIIAVSISPDEPRITLDVAEWAIAYVRHSAAITAQAVREHMHGGKFAKDKADILKCLTTAGDHGRTERDLDKLCAAWRNSTPQQRTAFLTALQKDGTARLADIPSQSGRGRKRRAWVATDRNAAPKLAIETTFDDGEDHETAG